MNSRRPEASRPPNGPAGDAAYHFDKDSGIVKFRLLAPEPPTTCRVLAATHLGRGFDFETVTGVLLAQQDVRCLDLPTPIRYARRGVSHFRYLLNFQPRPNRAGKGPN